MLKRILSQLKQLGYDEQSQFTEQQINGAFGQVLKRNGNSIQCGQQVFRQIWQMTHKDQLNKVRLGDYLANMQKENKLSLILPQSQVQQQDEIRSYQDRPLNYTTTQSVQPGSSIYSQVQGGQNRNQVKEKQQQPDRTLQYATSKGKNQQKVERNHAAQKRPEQPYKQARLPLERPEHLIPTETQSPSQKKTKKLSKPKQKQKRDSLKTPLLNHEQQKSQQKLQEQIYESLNQIRPPIKGNKSIIAGNKQSTTTRSLITTSQSTILAHNNLFDRQNKDRKDREDVELKNGKKKCLKKRWFVPMCIFILGIVLFTGSFIIHSLLKQKAIDQVILSPQNEGIWAHFPGDTKCQIYRNWTFFNITNAQQMLFYNQKPKFKQIQGFIIIEQQDYLNITYIQDGDRVQMVDWLHFVNSPLSRDLDQKVKVLNLGGLGYWYNLKIARPAVILQQGLGLLFTTIEQSIIENIYAQAIKVQFLNDFEKDAFPLIFAPAGITQDQAIFIWQDPAYGIGNQNSLKYWIEAIPSEQEKQSQTVSHQFTFLLNYFTLELSQLDSILDRLAGFISFISNAVLQNNYCQAVSPQNCTGRYLAYRQFSQSFVTRNPPSGTPIQPTDSICESNSTCQGYVPEIQAFYEKVYLMRHPQQKKILTFPPEWMKQLVDYNNSIDTKLDYNTRQNCLFHIGNLDALWDNGTMFDNQMKKVQNDHPIRQEEEYGLFGQSQIQIRAIPNGYLENIRKRFSLPSLQHAHVFWEWTKYLSNQVILRNSTNQMLGVGNLFAKGLYQAFTYLQDNLQQHLLTELIYHTIQDQGKQGDCSNFIRQSLQLRNSQTALDICDRYGQKISKWLIQDLISACTQRYGKFYKYLKNRYNLMGINMEALCDANSEEFTFGRILHQNRVYLNRIYKCDITPKGYCSDFQLGAIQWASSMVTLNPPLQLSNKLQKSHTYNSWNKAAKSFQYGFYKSKYPQSPSQFPEISVRHAYELLNFDSWFSASVVLKQFINEQKQSKLNQNTKQYMRYVAVQVGLNGLTMQRSPRQLIFGYKDKLLQQVKNAYPPFGGDPSTPSLVAFNDPNITQQQATMTVQWSTGKKDSSLVGQFRKINGLTYLNIQKDSFNGNVTVTELISPWDGQDYVYGTSAKQFSPNQFEQPNISLYVPNIQRYGSGVIGNDYKEERFGFQLEIGYLGEYIYESTSQSDDNKKYYQKFHGIFNETSVVGIPLFVSKNHFMNASSNWSSLVQIYNQNGTIQYEKASKYDDSFVVVQPYTGLSFQSTIYLQSNYYHNPDALLNFYNESMMPIFSCWRSGNITQDVANDLLGSLSMGLAAIKWIRIIGIIVVVVSCIVCGVIYFMKKRKDRRQSKKVIQTKGDKQYDTDKQKNMLKSSQLGISLQPITSPKSQQYKPLVRQQYSLQRSQNQYIPPPVVVEQI